MTGSAADSVDYDLFMEGTKQEGGSLACSGRAGRKELTGQTGRECGGDMGGQGTVRDTRNY